MLTENLGKFLATKILRSRRDLTRISARSQNLGGQKLTEILAEILKSLRDLGEISAAKNSPRTSPRSRRDPKISSKFSPRSWRDLRISAAKTSPRFLLRSQNLGGQKLAEILAEISKSRQPQTHRESRQDFR